MLVSRPHLPWGDVQEFADRVLKAVCMGQHRARARDDDAAPGDRRSQLDATQDRNCEHSPSDNPFFARVWTVMSAHETDAIRRLRRENLAGLSGRVLEVGAGTGTNFEFYPETVTEVVAVEPERRLAEKAQQAAATAPVPVTSPPTRSRVHRVPAGAVRRGGLLARAVFCRGPGKCAAPAAFVARPGGELRYLEHIASAGGGAGCRSSPTPRSGRGCSATAIRIGRPNPASSVPGSRWRARGTRHDADVGAAAGGGVRDRPRGERLVLQREQAQNTRKATRERAT